MDKVDGKLLDDLDNTQPSISQDLVRELLAEQGCDSPDPRCTKLACVAIERFLGKSLNGVLDVMASRPATNTKAKDVGGVLTLYDLVHALQESGIAIDKPAFYVSKPAS